MGSGTVAGGFWRKKGLKQRHLFLAPLSSGDLNKRFEVRGNLGRRKLIEPMFTSGSLELPVLDGHINDKANDTINQGSHDSHERDHGSPAQGSDRRLAQDGIVFLEGAVGSFGCRSQAMQLAVTLGAPGDFEKQARVLGNGDKGGYVLSCCKVLFINWLCGY